MRKIIVKTVSYLYEIKCLIVNDMLLGRVYQPQIYSVEEVIRKINLDK